MLEMFPPSVQPYVLPASVGLAVALACLLLFATRRRSPKSNSLRPASSARSSQWITPAPAFADRRTSTRREGGNPVKVILASPAFKSGTHVAYVLDRLTGGLRIGSTTALPTGSSVQVRAAHAPEESPWVTIIIRSCKASGKSYVMGCEFDKTPPWNVLLLFG